jgi:hypothetical protein
MVFKKSSLEMRRACIKIVEKRRGGKSCGFFGRWKGGRLITSTAGGHVLFLLRSSRAISNRFDMYCAKLC